MNSHNHQDFRFRQRQQEPEYRVRMEPQRPPSRTVSSESLFNGTYEIGIDHGGSLYRLKITRQGKLILNK